MIFFNKVPMTFPLSRKVKNTIFYKEKNWASVWQK